MGEREEGGEGGEMGGLGVVVGFMGGMIFRCDKGKRVGINGIVVCRMVSINGILYSYCTSPWGC